MMLLDVIILLSLLGGVAAAIVSRTTWYIAILIGIGSALGSYIGLIVLTLLFALVISLFVDKSKPVEGPVNGFWRFMTVQVVDGINRISGMKLTVIGEEKIPKDRRFLLVSNHLSRFDPMICMVRWRRYNIAFVSKPSNFKIPIAGGFIHKCKFLAIDRENPRSAVRTLRAASEYIRSDEMSVGIYPEGMRSTNGELLEFHDGVFKVAFDTKAPIVVVTVKGTDKIAKNFPWRRTPVEMRVKRVIEPEEYAGMRTGEISRLVREVMTSDNADEA